MTARAPDFMGRDEAARLVRGALGPPGRIEEGPPGMGEVPPALVHEPGGDVMRRLQHPAFTTLERMQRIGPPTSGAWFSPQVSLSNTVQFELVNFEVPRGQQAWVFDYEFQVYRQSGVDPGDIVKAEEGRYSSSIGFDVTVDGQRIGAIQYGLVPVPQPSTFRPVPPSFEQGTATQGRSLLPARLLVAGARGAPFTVIANEGQRVVLTCVIFRRLRTAVAAIEGRLGGYLVATNFAQALVNRMRPR